MKPSEERPHSETQSPPPSDGVYQYEFTVSEAEIDGNGHVNNVSYVQWMQDVAIRHAKAASSAHGMGGGTGIWVARSHFIEYLRPAYAGDLVGASTWIADLSRVRSRRRYKFVRRSDGVVLARGETDWVFINPESGRPCSIPDEIKAAFTLVPDQP